MKVRQSYRKAMEAPEPSVSVEFSGGLSPVIEVSDRFLTAYLHLLYMHQTASQTQVLSTRDLDKKLANKSDNAPLQVPNLKRC